MDTTHPEPVIRDPFLDVETVPRTKRPCSIPTCKKIALMAEGQLFCKKCRDNGKAEDDRFYTMTEQSSFGSKALVDL